MAGAKTDRTKLIVSKLDLFRCFWRAFDSRLEARIQSIEETQEEVVFRLSRAVAIDP